MIGEGVVEPLHLPVTGCTGYLYALDGDKRPAELIDTFFSSTSRLEVVYPRRLQSPTGYVLFVAHPDHIGWTQLADFAGTGRYDRTIPVQVAKIVGRQLEQQQTQVQVTGRESLIVGEPVEFGYTFKPMIHTSGPLDTEPQRIVDQKNVACRWSVEVLDENDRVAHSYSQHVVAVPDQSVSVASTWTTPPRGTFRVRMTLSSNDSVFVTPLSHTINAEISVYQNQVSRAISMAAAWTSNNAYAILLVLILTVLGAWQTLVALCRWLARAAGLRIRSASAG